jgi:hypothetical protein
METRFPGSNRSFVKLKGIQVCGGDMNVAAVETILKPGGLWDQLADARKNAFKQAAIIGFDTLLLVLLRAVDLEQAAKKVSKKINIPARAIECPYAEIAMDVDKPHQLELLTAELEKQTS